jgi:ubiquinone biosynthesis UbiH/UbiF/VisC/COQ6 family hydroxylase
MSSQDQDIIVCGGGVAGAAAAALLAGSGLSVVLIDGRLPAETAPDDDIDPRVVAISPGSQRILQATGSWPRLSADRIGPYRRMQVQAGGQLVEFLGSEHGLDHLGWIVEIPALQKALWQQLADAGQVQILAPARVTSAQLNRDRIRIDLDNGQSLRAALLVAADGAHSPLRRQAGIEVDAWHYNQKALVTHIRTEQANDGLAWQRFTHHGPLALLPLADGRSSIVWSQPDAQADDLLTIESKSFLDTLNRHMDGPFGAAIDCGIRHALPLVRRKARALVQGRLVLLGDAARTVHPLAGQGLNLGLADAAALAEVLTDWQSGQEPGPALARYERWRLSASELIGGGIHAINEIARTPAGIGSALLGVGFFTAARLWPVREAFVVRACGLDSDSPRLARETPSR